MLTPYLDKLIIELENLSNYSTFSVEDRRNLNELQKIRKLCHKQNILEN